MPNTHRQNPFFIELYGCFRGPVTVPFILNVGESGRHGRRINGRGAPTGPTSIVFWLRKWKPKFLLEFLEFECVCPTLIILFLVPPLPIALAGAAFIATAVSVCITGSVLPAGAGECAGLLLLKLEYHPAWPARSKLTLCAVSLGLRSWLPQPFPIRRCNCILDVPPPFHHHLSCKTAKHHLSLDHPTRHSRTCASIPNQVNYTSNIDFCTT